MPDQSPTTNRRLIRLLAQPDLLAALFLLLPPLILFGSVTLGSNTLLPVDNLYAHEPWLTYRDELGVGLPQNQLLSDLILQNYAWKRFIQDSLANGELPLWNPYILTGQPFLANGQHSAYYPFSLIFYLLPLPSAYGWFTVSQLWLAALSMYTFLRVLRLGRIAALVGGLTYSLSGFFVVSVVFTMIIAGAVWLPLLLACIEIVIRKQTEKGLTDYSPIPYIVAGAGVLGLQTLAGHVEITYYTLLVSGFYAACRLAMLGFQQRTLRYVIRLGLWLLLMVLLGLGIGAVQLVPMYEVVSQNFRDDSASLAQVREWALPMRRLISFVIPDFFGSPAHHGYFDVVTRTWQPLGLNAHGDINPLCPNCTSWDTKTAVEAGAYVGILPLLLALIAIVHTLISLAKTQRRKENQSDSWRLGDLASQPTILIFTALALLSLLFAFGTPLYGLLFYGLPGWNQLHSPFRWIFPYTLSLAVLAACGTQILQSHLGGAKPAPPRCSLRYLARFCFGSGLLGLLLMLTALALPTPFISIATLVFEQSGLAQNAFADGRQFFGYQWPNFVKFFAVLTAAGAVLGFGIYDLRFTKRLRKPSVEPAETDFDKSTDADFDKLSRRSIWQPMLIVVVSLDLLMAGYGFNPSVETRLLEFTPPVVEWLKAQQTDDPFFRLTSFDTPEGRGNKIFLANAGMPHGLFDVRGYDSIIPAQYGRFMQLIQPNNDLLFNRIGPIYHDGYAALDSALLDLLGVRYVLTTVEIPNPNYALVYDNEIRVYENLDVLPRAFLVPHAIDMTAASWDEMSLALRSLNPREQVLLEGASLQLDQAPPIDGTLNGEVTITDYTPREVRLTVSLDQPAWLVLADSHFDGWRAYVAPQLHSARELETETPIYRANGNFRAIQLEAGEWQVRFRYSPRSFQLGLYGSFLATVTLLLLAAYWGWSRLYREHVDDTAIKRIAKNSLVPMIMAISNRLIDFAFALLMLRILQPDGAGRYAFAVAFISLTEILTRYGLGTLVTREVAAESTRSNRYLSNVTILRAYLWLIALPFMATVGGIYWLFGTLTADVLITIGIFAIGTLFSNISDGLTAIFYAHEKAEYPAAIASITTLTRVSLGALVLLIGWGIIGLAIASLVANLVACAVLSFILMSKLFRPQFEVDGQLQWSMLGESLPLMLNHLLSTIFFRIDVFILAPTWGDNAVGYYNAAYKYVDGINVIPQYFTLAIFPLMSRFAANSRESLIRAYILSLRLLLMVALPIAVGTPFVAETLILFLAGERFVPDSVIVLQLLIWFLPFSFINQVTQYVLIAVNQQRALTRAFVIGVSFNLIANLVFVPMYGYRAAAITTIISEWALLIPFYYLVRQHLCTVNWVDVVWRPTVAAAVMGLTLWSLNGVGFGLTVLIGGASYLLTLTLVGGLHQPDMAVIWRVLPNLRKTKTITKESV